MKVIDLPMTSIRPADWNPNRMDEAMRSRMRASVERFGMVAPLVVRAIGAGMYEIIGGEQRFIALSETKAVSASCVVVTADDAEARLLAQALNHIAGTEDIGLRAETLRSILESVPQAEILSLLPETAESLEQLVSIGEEDLSEHLRAWNQAQSARLKHMTFQLTAEQLAVVTRALDHSMVHATAAMEEVSNPNQRGNALYHLSSAYLESVEEPAAAYTRAYRRSEA